MVQSTVSVPVGSGPREDPPSSALMKHPDKPMAAASASDPTPHLLDELRIDFSLPKL